MDRLNYKYEQLSQALKILEKAVSVFDLFKKEGKSYNPHMDYTEEYQGHRDSVIQRFEYCSDLFWKYLKKYLESLSLVPDIKAPREVIRASFSAGLLSEKEAEESLGMIKSRNITSHTYIEEVAKKLVEKIPETYSLMHSIVQRLVPKE